jgi:hypothetical protein
MMILETQQRHQHRTPFVSSFGESHRRRSPAVALYTGSKTGIVQPPFWPPVNVIFSAVRASRRSDAQMVARTSLWLADFIPHSAEASTSSG